MTQILDPTSPIGICVWDEYADGCEIPDVEPLIRTDREQELIEFIFGKYQPECDLSCMPDPSVVPLPAGVGLLLTGLALLCMVRIRWRQ